MLREITIQNLLSFGDPGVSLNLRPLNVLIGVNGSGKSNLIEAISLLQSAPRLLASPVRDGGGIADWLWKGAKKTPVATLEVLVDNPDGKMPLRFALSFTEAGRRFDLVDERIENEKAYPGQTKPYFYYRFQGNRPVLNVKGKPRALRREDVDPEKSILSQRKDPDFCPEITYLGEQFGSIAIYREWCFGRYTAPRQPQKADGRNDFLEEDCTNLGLVLSRLRRDPAAKARLVQMLNRLYEGIEDFDVSVEGGSVQVFFHEGKTSIPATRLSDGTLRFLCLLAILCHPSPPPLVCIEEPELGLHPDAVVAVGELLRETAGQTQLIVTTHSQVLLDCLRPEDVIVCERLTDQTTLRRLDAEELAKWEGRYALSHLWRRGDLGGNRW